MATLGGQDISSFSTEQLLRFLSVGKLGQPEQIKAELQSRGAPEEAINTAMNSYVSQHTEKSLGSGFLGNVVNSIKEGATLNSIKDRTTEGIKSVTEGNPLDWGGNAIKTDPVSQLLLAGGDTGTAGAYGNTMETLGQLYALYAGGSALAGGETAAGGGLTAEAAGSTAAMTPEAYAAGTAAGYGTTGTAASAGLGTAATTALPAAGMIGTGSTTAAESTLGGVGASTGGAGTSNTLGSLAAGSALAGGNSGGESTASTESGGFWDSAGNWVSNNSSGLGALLQGGSALWAGQQGVDAANKATDELRRQFDIGQTNAAPWLEAGKTALGAQQDLMGLGENGPEAQLSSLMNSPGYQFRLNTGRRNLEASSAARGGMGSGKAATAMNQYGQDYASNEYGNRLNQLAGVSGTGQTQANQNMNTGMNYAGEMGNASLAGAQARQSGILGAGNALSNWMNPQPKQLTLADLLRSK